MARTGAGEVISLAKLTVLKLKTAIAQVLSEATYRENAVKMQTDIQNAGGVTKAADIIEQVMKRR